MADRDPPPMNAAGWHVCLDVLEPALVAATPARVVGSMHAGPAGKRCGTDYAERWAVATAPAAPWKTASMLLPSGSRTNAPK